ncbi:hypothetical protein Tco_0486619 [Tanacetum coccineum]
MADHSQKWHDGSSSRNIESSSNSEGIVAIINKLENLNRDIKKLKENVSHIQEGAKTQRAHLNKDSPLQGGSKKHRPTLDTTSPGGINAKE